jgi:hypothetical protein
MSRRPRVTAALALATACSTGLLALPPAAFAAVAPGGRAARPAVPAPGPPGASGDARGQAGVFDIRQGTTRAQEKARAGRAAALQAAAPVRALARQLGSQSVIDLDPLTGTPRQVARLDGLLTGPSAASADDVALGYVRAHADVFGLSGDDLARLELVREYVDIEGIHHLAFVQQVGGVPLFGNGLEANVTRDGRLVNVTGSPVPGLRAPDTLRTGLSVDAAIRLAKKDIGEAQVAPAKGDTGQPVLFHTAGGTRRAIQTVTMSAATPSLDVIDAETGRVLYRDLLSADLAGSGVNPIRAAARRDRAEVFEYYPGAKGSGGTTRTVSLNRPGWLPRGSVVLFGNNVHTYSDVNDNNVADAAEEVSPVGRTGYRFPVVTTKVAGEPCSAWACTWDPGKAFSWRKNDERTATQNFYFINTWHDYLARAPIGFTEAAGNFQQVNSGGSGKGGDPVHDESLDGADTQGGLPDLSHIDNANFATPPDGQSPTMQMYLWHVPGASSEQDPFIPTMGSDEADIVYHEYTHGLSHRLVTDANNNPALDSVQGGSMGEAWSDWYALDYLVNQGHIKDTRKAGDVNLGLYVGAGQGIRSEGMDCPVGSTAAACPGTRGTSTGGYTYGDFGRIFDATGDVHAAGEIWAQTLWDLRGSLGHKLTESLVTRGMELSPTYPSFLDMRNAILQADRAVNRGAHARKIWKVFAKRGMGFFAGTVSGDDLHPVEDFSTPPSANTPRGTLSGRVTDQSTGGPVSGATVAFGGHSSGFPGDYAATTGSGGGYTIPGILPGSYPDVVVSGAGYDPQLATLSVGRGTTTRNWSIRRDWAAASGGGAVTRFTGPDYTVFGCGPGADIDQSLGTGWGSEAGGPKLIVIRLPQAVRVSTFAIDPSNTCGDGPGSATAGYTLETSADGTAWTVAARGTFTAADLGRLNTVTPRGSATAVRYVRFTMLSPQDPKAQYMDSSEVAAYGTPSGG